MKVSLENIGKKFSKTWIFKGLSYEFLPGEKYAILGNNGSGKSSLIKIISGQSSPNAGRISYENTEADEVYKKLSLCAPYMDLVEELNLEELLLFVEQFKAFHKDYPVERILNMFPFKKDKWIKDYSSGMKQRVKLALALFSDVDLCLLDEPSTNLDEEGMLWLQEQLEQLPTHKTLIIASNLEREYSLCKHFIEISKYKN
ncbi:MAG: ATP-binding cassette domain-containing protein [Chitinophagales bacterium]